VAKEKVNKKFHGKRIANTFQRKICRRIVVLGSAQNKDLITQPTITWHYCEGSVVVKHVKENY
jgi:hypothetical protein